VRTEVAERLWEVESKGATIFAGLTPFSNGGQSRHVLSSLKTLRICKGCARMLSKGAVAEVNIGVGLSVLCRSEETGRTPCHREFFAEVKARKLSLFGRGKLEKVSGGILQGVVQRNRGDRKLDRREET